jgi:glycosyltransferase involved in cell wall biosynthesis
MRVLHIETGRHRYGGAAQVEYLLAGLNGARVDNVLVCAAGGELAARAGSAPADPRRADSVRADSTFDVVALPAGGDLDIALAGRLRRVLRARRPDLVHVHSRRGADLYGGIAARLEGIPAVLTRRVDSGEPALWARLKYAPYARLVALSRAIEAQLRAAGIAGNRIARIPSAVDTQRYRPDPTARARLRALFDLRDDALVVGVVAQLIPRKRHAWLISELPALVRREPRLRVLCFGRGPLENRLRAEIAALGLDAHVRLAGFRDDLPGLLPGLDLLAHPAEREGLGVALLEAASCGVAIVAAAAGGVPDVLEKGRTAAVVEVDDAEGFARATLRLLGDEHERRRLGNAARADVERRFSVAALVRAHLDLYSAVLDAGPRLARAARQDLPGKGSTAQ